MDVCVCPSRHQETSDQGWPWKPIMRAIWDLDTSSKSLSLTVCGYPRGGQRSASDVILEVASPCFAEREGCVCAHVCLGTRAQRRISCTLLSLYLIPFSKGLSLYLKRGCQAASSTNPTSVFPTHRHLPALGFQAHIVTHALLYVLRI